MQPTATLPIRPRHQVSQAPSTRYALRALMPLGLVLSLALPSLCLAGGNDYGKGFRRATWGMALTAAKGAMVKSDNKIPPYKAYKLKGDKLAWEGITASAITYGFKGGKFGALNISFSKKDSAKVIQAFTKKFGAPKKTDLFVMTNYEWHPKTLDISLVVSPGGASINMKPKK